MEGWVKLHRKILENPVVCKDSEYFSIWIYLILNATHSTYKVLFAGSQIELKSGQLITGRKSISEKFNIDESKVQRVLKTLEIEQQIKQQTSNKNRLITILNWDTYQQIEQQDTQQLNNNCTTTEQQLNTNKNVKNINNGNNVKNVKQIKDIVASAPLIYFTDDKLNSTFLDFISMRKKLKNGAMTDRAIELMIKKINGMDPDTAIYELERSITNNWKDIYLSDNTKSQKPVKEDFNTMIERWAMNQDE